MFRLKFFITIFSTLIFFNHAEASSNSFCAEVVDNKDVLEKFWGLEVEIPNFDIKVRSQNAQMIEQIRAFFHARGFEPFTISNNFIHIDSISPDILKDFFSEDDFENLDIEIFSRYWSVGEGMFNINGNYVFGEPKMFLDPSKIVNDVTVMVTLTDEFISSSQDLASAQQVQKKKELAQALTNEDPILFPATDSVETRISTYENNTTPIVIKRKYVREYFAIRDILKNFMKERLQEILLYTDTSFNYLDIKVHPEAKQLVLFNNSIDANSIKKGLNDLFHDAPHVFMGSGTTIE